jgi:hypothetical protein
VCAWYSISRAAWASTSKPRIDAGASSKPWPTLIDAASMSSKVAAPVSTSCGNAEVALLRSENTATVVVASFATGIVSKTASRQKPACLQSPQRGVPKSSQGLQNPKRNLARSPWCFNSEVAANNRHGFWILFHAALELHQPFG